MSQKLPVDGFECIEETSQFNEDFIKNCDEDSDIGYFLEFEIQYSKKLHDLQIITIFTRKNEHWEGCKTFRKFT